MTGGTRQTASLSSSGSGRASRPGRLTRLQMHYGVSQQISVVRGRCDEVSSRDTPPGSTGTNCRAFR